MRRLLSSAVIIREAPSPEAILLSDAPVGLYTPTDREMRDAMARVTRDLDDLLTKRTDNQPGWEAVETNFQPTISPDGSVVLRGFLVIERAD